MDAMKLVLFKLKQNMKSYFSWFRHMGQSKHIFGKANCTSCDSLWWTMHIWAFVYQKSWKFLTALSNIDMHLAYVSCAVRYSVHGNHTSFFLTRYLDTSSSSRILFSIISEYAESLSLFSVCLLVVCCVAASLIHPESCFHWNQSTILVNMFSCKSKRLCHF